MSKNYKLYDLTSIGLPSVDFGDWVLSNSSLYKMSPDRFNFYIQLLDSLSSSNPEASKNTFKIYNMNKYNNERINEKLDFIRYYFDNNVNKKLKDKHDNAEDVGEEIINNINNKLKQSLMANNIQANLVKGGGGEDGKQNQAQDGQPNNEDVFKKYVEGVTGDTELADNKYYYTDNDTGRIIIKNDGTQNLNDNKEKVLQTYKNSIEYGPDVEKVHMSDRVIFVIATYVFRSIALFMVEWGVHINYINNFIKAFSLYFGVYACIFLILVILTNASDKDKIFRMLFFYINTQSESGKGNLRIIIHLACLLFLFPIPFIVREYREMKNKTLSFTDKRTIINAVNKFTMLTWILTSIIALRI